MTDKRSLDEAIGKTVKTVSQETQYHSLDNLTDETGPITIKFTDGSVLEISSIWCNDDMADTEWEWLP